MIVHKSQLTQLFTNRKCQFAVVAMLALVSQAAPTWPTVTRDMRPWCYNWWMGSAVDAKGLEAQADALAKAGFGGLEEYLMNTGKEIEFILSDFDELEDSALAGKLVALLDRVCSKNKKIAVTEM